MAGPSSIPGSEQALPFWRDRSRWLILGVVLICSFAWHALREKNDPRRAAYRAVLRMVRTHPACPPGARLESFRDAGIEVEDKWATILLSLAYVDRRGEEVEESYEFGLSKTNEDWAVVSLKAVQPIQRGVSVEDAIGAGLPDA